MWFQVQLCLPNPICLALLPMYVCISQICLPINWSSFTYMYTGSIFDHICMIPNPFQIIIHVYVYTFGYTYIPLPVPIGLLTCEVSSDFCLPLYAHIWFQLTLCLPNPTPYMFTFANHVICAYPIFARLIYI